MTQDIIKRRCPICGGTLWQNFEHDIVGKPLPVYHCVNCKAKILESSYKQDSYVSDSAKELRKN